MFTAQDFCAIDRDYFIVLEATPLYVRLQSKNTKHFWRIYPKTGKKCLIQHAHGAYDEFHDHDHAKSLTGALAKITDHDNYQLSCRRSERHTWDEYVPQPLKADEPSFIIYGF